MKKILFFAAMAMIAFSAIAENGYEEPLSIGMQVTVWILFILLIVVLTSPIWGLIWYIVWKIRKKKKEKRSRELVIQILTESAEKKMLADVNRYKKSLEGGENEYGEDAEFIYNLYNIDADNKDFDDIDDIINEDDTLILDLTTKLLLKQITSSEEIKEWYEDEKSHKEYTVKYLKKRISHVAKKSGYKF